MPQAQLDSAGPQEHGENLFMLHLPARLPAGSKYFDRNPHLFPPKSLAIYLFRITVATSTCPFVVQKRFPALRSGPSDQLLIMSSVKEKGLIVATLEVLHDADVQSVVPG
jgi:hypothetical protein